MNMQEVQLRWLVMRYLHPWRIWLLIIRPVLR